MKFHKFTAIILASAMLLTSCTGSTSDDDTATDSTQSTDIAEERSLLTHIFRAEEIVLPMGYSVNEGVMPTYDPDSGEISCVAYSDDEIPDPEAPDSTIITRQEHILTLAEDGTILADTVIQFEDSDVALRYGVFTDSGLVGVTYLNSAGGREEYAVVRLSGADYAVEKTEALTPLFSNTATIFSDDLYISGMAVDKDGSVWICAYSELLCLDENFIRTFSVLPYDSMNGDYFESIATSGDGKVYVGGFIGGEDALCPIDKDSRSLGMPVEFDGSFDTGTICFGEGYDLYFKNTVGLYGLTTSDGASTLLMNFANSDVISPAILGIVSPDAFFSSGDTSLLLYKKAEDIDMDGAVVLELAATFRLTPMYTDAVNEFNKAGSGVRIVVTEYVPDENTTDAAHTVQDRLIMDMLTGRYEPDIIITSGTHVTEQVIENEIYTDLYTLIDKDDTVTRENLFDCVEEMFSDEGKMWGIGHEFTVSSILGTREMLGERESWTFTEMLDFAENLPSDIEFFDLLDQFKAKEALLGGGGYSYFIDEDSGTCSFDSPEFIRLLEYLKTLPEYYDTSDLPRDYDKTVYPEYHNGNIALKQVSFFTSVDWLGLEADFNTKYYTLIGYPVNDMGKSAYANANQKMIITSYTDHPKKAWEFVKSIINPEFDGNSSSSVRKMISEMTALPVLRTVFDAYAEENYKYCYTYNFSGSTSRAIYDLDSPPAEPREEGIQLFYTPEAHEEFKEFLDTKVGGQISEVVNEEVLNIINEEISSFNSGLRDAQSTARMIQSRVSLWLAEHE